MVTITDTAGNDLVAAPPASLTLLTSGLTASCRLRYVVTETEALPAKTLTTTVHWGDGNPDTTLTGTGTLSVDVVRALPVGVYTINVFASDLALPDPSTAAVNLTVNVVPNPQIAAPENVVFGPVVPRDAGFPGPTDWLFNTGHDIGVLESALKVLLTTRRGERLMEPDYGTLLYQLLFNPVTDNLKAAVVEEVTTVVARWEPRVELRDLAIFSEPSDGRQVVLQLDFVSKITNQSINLTLQYAND